MNEPVLVSAVPATDRRRLVALVGVGLVLVLLLLVAPRVLAGGGGGADPIVEGVATATSTPTTAPTNPAARAESTAAPVGGKDPFKPLVTPRAPERAAPPVAAKVPAKSTLRLTDVHVDAAGRATVTFKLDGSDVTAKPGQQFGGSYRVLDLDPTAKCGHFLFGDQPFAMCAGESSSF